MHPKSSFWALVCQRFMNNTRRCQFSLMTLMLSVTIVALLMSNFVIMRELNQARTEIEKVRKQFGFLRIDDTNLIHVSRIEGDHSSNWSNSYRLYIPPGHHFLLHIAETDITDVGEFEAPKPAVTLSMNSWKKGADVILNWGVQYDGEIPHLKVATQSEQLFDYKINSWKLKSGMLDGAHLNTSTQKTFRPDEEIRFMWSRDVATKRGVVFWMEPLSRQYPQER
jgi:hypothetical protein